MSQPLLFPRHMTPTSFIASQGGGVILPPDGVQLTTPELVVTLADSARIVNLPADLSVAAGTPDVSVTLGSDPVVVVSTPDYNVEICQ